MEYQKFIPEGWQGTNENYSIEFLKNAWNIGCVIEGKVNTCDENFNLHVKLSDTLEGVIPREEIDFINVDEFGLCKTNLCKNKVDTFVQFKVKDFEEKQVVEGIVKETDKYKNGIFVELKPNLVGLAEYKEGFNYGQKVNVYIKKIIKDKKKIKLLIV